MVATYQRLVEHMVGRIVDGREDREDLCQEIFVKVYFNLHRFRFDSKLSTWIAAIAYRETVNFLKKKSRRPVWNTPEQNRKLENMPGESRPDHWLENRDEQELLEQWIKELPEVQRTVLTLFHLEGFKYEEIAKVTGLPEGTVKSYLFRARRTLREKMERITQKTES